MTVFQDYLLSPLAPLVFRAGTPFGSTDAALTVDFPSPSTLAGALRAAARLTSINPELASQPVHGPLLMETSADGGQSEILFPTSADLLFARFARFRDDEDGEPKACALAPRQRPKGSGWDARLDARLLPVDFAGATRPIDKPMVGPAFLRPADYIPWLCGTRKVEDWKPPFGLPAIPRARREHVRIEPASQTAAEGILFRSQGLDYGPRLRGDDPFATGDNSQGVGLDYGPRLRGDDVAGRHYGLILRSALRVPDGCVRVGGRARLAHLAACSGLWPSCPRLLREHLRRSRGVRLILATPAIFAKGWLPGWLTEQDGVWVGRPDPELDLTLTLRAVAVADWQPASMRDAAGIRSPLRRMVPAGSVYWFAVTGDPALAADLWLRPLSDEEKDRNDGFGLALPGVWIAPPVT